MYHITQLVEVDIPLGNLTQAPRIYGSNDYYIFILYSGRHDVDHDLGESVDGSIE